MPLLFKFTIHNAPEVKRDVHHLVVFRVSRRCLRVVEPKPPWCCLTFSESSWSTSVILNKCGFTPSDILVVFRALPLAALIRNMDADNPKDFLAPPFCVTFLMVLDTVVGQVQGGPITRQIVTWGKTQRKQGRRKFQFRTRSVKFLSRKQNYKLQAVKDSISAGKIKVQTQKAKFNFDRRPSNPPPTEAHDSPNSKCACTFQRSCVSKILREGSQGRKLWREKRTKFWAPFPHTHTTNPPVRRTKSEKIKFQFFGKSWNFSFFPEAKKLRVCNLKFSFHPTTPTSFNHTHQRAARQLHKHRREVQ